MSSAQGHDAFLYMVNQQCFADYWLTKSSFTILQGYRRSVNPAPHEELGQPRPSRVQPFENSWARSWVKYLWITFV